MAYSEQTASSPDDIISKIATFAGANGWTIDRNDLSGANRTLTLRKATDYIHVYNTDTSNVRLRASVGYSAAAAPSAQPNVSLEAKANVGVGPYTKLFMFCDAAPSNHIHVVIELANGIFRMLSFGMVDKIGTWTGGTYVDASDWSTNSSLRYFWNQQSSSLFDSYSQSASWGSLRCDIPLDGRANAWAEMKYDAAYRALTGLHGGVHETSGGNGYLTTQYYDRNDPPFSGQLALGTIVVDVFRIGNFWSPAGAFPNVRYLNISRYSPGQEVPVGTDTWVVFPMCRKGTGTLAGNADYSDNHGYAFKKTA